MTHIGGDPLGIPSSWTFNDMDVASKFDEHVRGQLPWYDFASEITCELARGFIGNDAIVYDIGAGTGNMGLRLAQTVQDRNVRLIGIEPSIDMIASQLRRADCYAEMINAPVESVELEQCDVAISFLTTMFMPVAIRKQFLSNLFYSIRTGGALILVERFQNCHPYLNTLYSRIGWRMKYECNSKEGIVDKELSLSGIQRPLSIRELPTGYAEYFRSGDFAGYVWSKEA